jgi:hypothetical protein
MNSLSGVAWYTKSLSDNAPTGIIHSFSDGGHTTDCGKTITTNGRWFITFHKNPTCKKCACKNQELLDSFLDNLESTRPSFTRYSVYGVEEKFYQDYTSKKFKWKFEYCERNLSKFINKMKAKGFEEYSRCENFEGTSFVFYK